MIEPQLALIDKRDSFEIILDQLCGILLSESARQHELAQQTAGKDPSDWDIIVYQERANPFEEFLHTTHTAPAPIVNVWYDTSRYQPAGSDVVRKQRTESVYNIDCIASGIATDLQEGHSPGDLRAAAAVHRTARLCRNIIMSAPYTYLGLRPLVSQRWPDSLEKYQPIGGDNRPLQNIIGARLALTVTHNEYAPQIEGDDLELISVKVENNGEVVLAEVEYAKT